MNSIDCKLGTQEKYIYEDTRTLEEATAFILKDYIRIFII